ncbi:MAG: FAD-dependent oxidoreductase [Pseudooceanicola sp.]|jgi:glycine/D-amino acid oxidase-like deaminating enzyme|nr:FAD-dependent oxidoreductase [Pseudooceanicola sp.]
MKRIYPEYAYGAGPRSPCWWDETADAPYWPMLKGEDTVDVGIIGGGFTGVSAALHLARAGLSVAVIEANDPGWGASGRNGGFCCVGGSMVKDRALAARYGHETAAAYWQAEIDAVHLAESLINTLGIDCDRHSKGETQLAHRPRDMTRLRAKAEAMAGGTGPQPVLTEAADLESLGISGPFYGALTNPVGFGLNPRKYLFGLAKAAEEAGARFYRQSPVRRAVRSGNAWLLHSTRGSVRCAQVIVATNGYSSEAMPTWLAGRYMPAQSNVLVTRPLTQSELDSAGWTSDQVCYDTRGLLHYFRLMPDRRFLFGMRGGLMSSAEAEKRARARTRADFERMFPAWKNVESPNMWSGMVCLARNLTPFAGPVPDQPGMFAGLAYHGNGVAMGTYTGKLLAGLVQDRDEVPQVMATRMEKFPLGPIRRLLMPPFYIARALADM